jgi:hypothetical protein
MRRQRRVAVLVLEPVERLLLGLVVDVLDQRLHLLELRLEGVALLGRDGLALAVGVDRVLAAHEDRDLDAVVPVALEGGHLALGEEPDAHEVHRHHRDEHDRDGDRGVAAQADPDLAEHELHAHQRPPP